ncbi:MAG: M28 family peptidase [Dehalococcoidia bacterium]
MFRQGVRRPGYAADRWAEDWAERQFRAFGLERVRREPVQLRYWEPKGASLVVQGLTGEPSVPCFPLPHAASAEGVEADLVAFDPDRPERVRGAIALYDVSLLRVPHSWFVAGATSTYDPDGSFASSTHLLPFGREFQAVMEPAIEAGAVGFVGALSNYPGDSRDYYVPYDGVSRPIPGVWVSGRDGARLRESLTTGPLRARLAVNAQRETITSYNIVGELPGADEEVVIVGSHHDGPWSSAVEDGSGIALVLAQAAYWSCLPREERPHRLLFLLNAGHMTGGAGAAAFCEAHRAELESVVLEVHLEHAANEFAEQDGELRSTGEPEARWWFTSRVGRLETAVGRAIEAEDLRRSLVLHPEVFGPRPTTDGSEFYVAGVPIVNYLTAPFYLFDSMDTMDKVHRASLAPVTRAAIRIVESTAGVSAAAMRADRVEQ